MLREILLVVLWCLAVYVCAYDWSEIDEKPKRNLYGNSGTEQDRLT